MYHSYYFSKETVEIRKEIWEKVENLRKNGKYVVLVYDKALCRENRSPKSTS